MSFVITRAPIKKYKRRSTKEPRPGGIKDPERSIYFVRGKAARISGQALEACPYPDDDMRVRSLWLCGWHTADMELSA
ncbi:MAG: hypothetical protein CMK71_02775 [Pseudomonadaceae bacterium]|nr:hypothetical protein [Pseudomonadaceae bacterium]